jgi:hypothetical protein
MVLYTQLYPVVGVMTCRYVIMARVTNAMQPHDKFDADAGRDPAVVAYILPRLSLK